MNIESTAIDDTHEDDPEYVCRAIFFVKKNQKQEQERACERTNTY